MLTREDAICPSSGAVGSEVSLSVSFESQHIVLSREELAIRANKKGKRRWRDKVEEAKANPKKYVFFLSAADAMFSHRLSTL